MNGGRGLDFNSRTALCRKACKGISSPHAMSKSEEWLARKLYTKEANIG